MPPTHEQLRRFAKYVKMGARLSAHTDSEGQMPDGLDLNAVLWALGGIESSFGTCAHQPRFEPAYGRGGRYFSAPLDDKFGDAAAMSYGPWQVMFPNAYKAANTFITPSELTGCTFAALSVTVLWLDGYVIGRGARTLEQIADAWNTGSHRDAIRPAPKYLGLAQRYYAEWSP